LKTFTDKHSGERKTIETIKRVKEWFWVGDNGKINLAVKYGAKTLRTQQKGCQLLLSLANGDELISYS
jgi:hypothetical protein